MKAPLYAKGSFFFLASRKTHLDRHGMQEKLRVSILSAWLFLRIVGLCVCAKPHNSSSSTVFLVGGVV